MNCLDNHGYPTDEFLKFIEDYTGKEMPFDEFLSLLKEIWQYGDDAFVLHKPYRGKRKLEVHTAGWSGNEDIIYKIIGNIYLTHFLMEYKEWHTGGHFYFEISTK